MIIVETSKMWVVIEKAREENFGCCIGISRRVVSIYSSNGKTVPLDEFKALPGVIHAFLLTEAYRMSALDEHAVDRIMKSMRR